ncbi:MAG: hypothetical protein ACREUA_01085 [Burkholderiales bacterium]
MKINIILTITVSLFLSACGTISASKLTPERVALAFGVTAIALKLSPVATDIVDRINELSPTWGVKESALGKGRYRISLRKKVFESGGEGEAGSIFKRHARRIAEQNGYDDYVLIEYTEGIESFPLGVQRVAQGVILCRNDVIQISGWQ